MSARSRRRHRRTSRKRNPFLLALLVLGSMRRRSAVLEPRSLRAQRRSRGALDRRAAAPIEVGRRTRSSTRPTARCSGYIQSDEVRQPGARSARIPQDLKDATVAIEDRRFYEHSGIDLEGVVRAGCENLTAGRGQAGRLDDHHAARPQPLHRGPRARPRAQDQGGEARQGAGGPALDKDWILERVPEHRLLRHHQRRAPRSASRRRPRSTTPSRAKDLDLAAGGDDRRPAPGALPVQPAPQPDGAALERRNEVLARDGASRATSPRARPTEARRPRVSSSSPGDKYSEIREPYFFDFVEQQLIEEYGVNTVRNGGLKVLYDDRPRAAGGRRATRSRTTSTTRTDPSAAVVSIDPSNGYIRAMASSGQLLRASSSTSPPRATASPARPSRSSP